MAQNNWHQSPPNWAPGNSQPKLHWQTEFSEPIGSQTVHLIGAVLMMQLITAESSRGHLLLGNWRLRMAQNEPQIKVVLHWQEIDIPSCQVEIWSNSEGHSVDPWTFKVAQLLRQILTSA